MHGLNDLKSRENCWGNCKGYVVRITFDFSDFHLEDASEGNCHRSSYWHATSVPVAMNHALLLSRDETISQYVEKTYCRRFHLIDLLYSSPIYANPVGDLGCTLLTVWSYHHASESCSIVVELITYLLVGRLLRCVGLLYFWHCYDTFPVTSCHTGLTIGIS